MKAAVMLAIIMPSICSIGAAQARLQVVPQDVKEEIRRLSSAPTAPLLRRITQVQKVCAGVSLPQWIRVDDHWDPMQCGNPGSPLIYNVWTVERYDDRPVGAYIEACNDRLPAGWVRVSERWDPTRCGRPTSTQFRNVMIARRVQ